MLRSLDPKRYVSFRGIDRASNPFNLPEGVTDDCDNVYEKNGWIVPMPGATEVVTMPGAPSDMVTHAMLTRDATPTELGKSLYILHNTSVSSTVIQCSVYDLATSSLTGDAIVVDSTSTNAWAESRLIPCGTNMIHITSRSPGTGSAPGAGHKLTYASAAHAVSANAPNANFRNGAWHRDRLFLCHAAATATALEQPYLVDWSDYYAPETFSAANTMTLRPKGRIDGIRGMTSVGDVLYLLGTQSIWALTGATEETFQLERCSSDIGIWGPRGNCSAEGALYGWECRSSTMAAGGMEAAYISNVVKVKDLGVEIIGNPIMPLVGSFSDFGGSIYSPADRLVLMGGVTANGVFPYDLSTGSWWRWSGRTFSRGAVSEFYDRVYYAEGSKIYYLNPDVAPTPTAYWTTQRILVERGLGGRVVPYIKYVAAGAGDMTIAVARNEADFATVATQAVTTTATMYQHSLSGDVGSADYIRVKLTFSSTSRTNTGKIGMIEAGTRNLVAKHDG